MRILAILAVIWLLTIAIGTGFHVLGQIIWFGIIASIIYALIEFIQRR